METAEFNKLAEETVRGLLPRIPQEYAGGFDGIFTGGEHWMAVEDLVHTLVDDRVSVTPRERDALRRLVQDMGDDELLQELDRLVVAEGSAGQ